MPHTKRPQITDCFISPSPASHTVDYIYPDGHTEPVTVSENEIRSFSQKLAKYEGDRLPPKEKITRLLLNMKIIHNQINMFAGDKAKKYLHQL
jgi:hypothetical protein